MLPLQEQRAASCFGAASGTQHAPCRACAKRAFRSPVPSPFGDVLSCGVEGFPRNTRRIVDPDFSDFTSQQAVCRCSMMLPALAQAAIDLAKFLLALNSPR